MKKVTLLILLTPAIVHAAAPFVDQFYIYRHWLFPAYAYCLLFGIIILLGLFITTLIYKDKIRTVTERISNYMKQHPFWAILFTGAILAIPLGIICSVCYEILWFISFHLILGLLIIYPIILSIERVREKLFLSPFFVKWSIMIAISAITASLLFIILTNYHLLPGTEELYWNYRIGHFSHPYDSIKEIWVNVPIFLAEIVLPLIVYGTGKLFKIVIRKIKKDL